MAIIASSATAQMSSETGGTRYTAGITTAAATDFRPPSRASARPAPQPVATIRQIRTATTASNASTEEIRATTAASAASGSHETDPLSKAWVRHKVSKSAGTVRRGPVETAITSNTPTAPRNHAAETARLFLRARSARAVTTPSTRPRTRRLNAARGSPRWRASHNVAGARAHTRRAVAQLNPRIEARAGTRTAIVTHAKTNARPTVSLRGQAPVATPSASAGTAINATPMQQHVQTTAMYADRAL